MNLFSFDNFYLKLHIKIRLFHGYDYFTADQVAQSDVTSSRTSESVDQAEWLVGKHHPVIHEHFRHLSENVEVEEFEVGDKKVIVYKYEYFHQYSYQL